MRASSSPLAIRGLARPDAGERSTGGRQRLGGISRVGNERLRQLLAVGAMAVIRHAKSTSKAPSPWLLGLPERRPRELAAVALADETAPAPCGPWWRTGRPTGGHYRPPDRSPPRAKGQKQEMAAGRADGRDTPLGAKASRSRTRVRGPLGGTRLGQRSSAATKAGRMTAPVRMPDQAEALVLRGPSTHAPRCLSRWLIRHHGAPALVDAIEPAPQATTPV